MKGSNSLNEVCHGGLGITRHVHQPLEVFSSPDGQHNFRVFFRNNKQMTNLDSIGDNMIHSNNPPKIKYIFHYVKTVV